MAFLFSSKFAGVSDPARFCEAARSAAGVGKGPTDAQEAVGGHGVAHEMSEGEQSARVGEGKEGREFDYVICGGGTAGCVLASRLSEDPNVTVLLVEAGESDQKQIFSRIPSGWGNLWKTPAEWNFETVPQAELGGRELYQPRGKMLGGCSSINAQIYQHCSPEDYDLWQKMGADGWSYNDLKPYFTKAEKFTPNPLHQLDEAKRGKDGVWCISYPPTNEMSSAMIEAGPTVGVPKNPDLNVETNSSGITRFQAIVDADGTRSSTSAAYLPSSVFNGRKNLSILTGTTCTRLVLSASANQDGKKKVTAIELGQTAYGPRWYTRARKEVIVCQGSFGSPQLLLASGIGGKETLEKAGVQQQLKLDGVGENLKDHVLVTIAFTAKKGTSCEWMKSPVKTLPSLVRWLANGSGPLGTNLAEVGAFVRSSDVQPDGTVKTGSGGEKEGEMNASGETSADLEIINAPLYFVHHALTPPPAGAETNDFFTMGAVILKPFSTGSVTIKDGDAFEKPMIDPKYLSDERDKKVMLAGLRLLRRLSLTSPLKGYLISVANGPGGKVMSLDEWEQASDETLVKLVEEYGETIYHPMGTCKM
ncbi:hypothetical protein JCM8547_001969, partial [Rhodosporidiobolus lusitaniae]